MWNGRESGQSDPLHSDGVFPASYRTQFGLLASQLHSQSPQSRCHHRSDESATEPFGSAPASTGVFQPARKFGAKYRHWPGRYRPQLLGLQEHSSEEDFGGFQYSVPRGDVQYYQSSELCPPTAWRWQYGY